MRLEKIENIEVTRSYTQKVNMGNYQSQDFFSSYKAIVKGGATEEEIQTISDDLAEKAEEDVLSKIDPSKVVSRRQSMAELRAKIVKQEKEIEKLTEQVSKISPF